MLARILHMHIGAPAVQPALDQRAIAQGKSVETVLLSPAHTENVKTMLAMLQTADSVSSGLSLSLSL